jgi:hypothetical protein
MNRWSAQGRSCVHLRLVGAVFVCAVLEACHQPVSPPANVCRHPGDMGTPSGSGRYCSFDEPACPADMYCLARLFRFDPWGETFWFCAPECRGASACAAGFTCASSPNDSVVAHRYCIPDDCLAAVSDAGMPDANDNLDAGP